MSGGARSVPPWRAGFPPWPPHAPAARSASRSFRDGRVRALNREYRGNDYATDVLSFPGLDDTRVPPTSGAHARSAPHLGDIVIARGVARRQAKAAGHAEPTELRVLALHGLLHLLGYDHEQDSGEMARVEKRLRRKGGLREGLIERQ